MVDKVIISNRGALQKKYGAGGLAAVDNAVNALIAADAAKNLQTQCIWVDDAAAMQQNGATPPINEQDQRGYKAAVDAINGTLAPDYIVLLDGPDVVPHIELDNPLPNDGDNTVDSDLPYACDGAFSRDVARNLKITRVVGRIPNVPGATVPDKLVVFLRTAAQARSRAPAQYTDYFGLSADVWQASTAMSVDAAFGNHANLALAPPDGPPGTDNRLSKLAHFINCHGANISPEYYGQSGATYPIAMTSAQVAANAPAAAVIAAECCYGGQLYDPQQAGVDDPICIAYLEKGALGFVGSTNIAYGPATGNGQADLLTQYFFENVIAGASLGRGFLQARQQFVTRQKMSDPSNLKTLAQFVLFGDPSVVPCTAAKEDSPTQGILAADLADGVAQRKARRVSLASIGSSIIDGKAIPGGPGEASEAAKQKVRKAARDRGYGETREAVFSVRGGNDFEAASKAKLIEQSVMVVSTRFQAPSHIVAIRHLIAHIIGDGIATIQEAVSR